MEGKILVKFHINNFGVYRKKLIVNENVLVCDVLSNIKITMSRSDMLHASMQKALEDKLGTSDTYATSDDFRAGENPIEDVVWMVVGNCISENNISPNFILESVSDLGRGLNSAAQEEAADIIFLGVGVFNRISRNEIPTSIYDLDQPEPSKYRTP